MDYIEEHYDIIEKDMNSRNSASKRKEMMNKAIAEQQNEQQITNIACKTRKKREELSVSATKSIKKERVEIVVQFN